MARDNPPPCEIPPPRGPVAKKSPGAALILLVGASAAIGMVVNTAREESGRTVSAQVTSSGELEVRHLAGKQYLDAYQDIVGVWTACDGIAYVKAKAKFTPAQCDAMLEAKLLEEAAFVMAHTPGLKGPGHSNQRVAAVLLTHNIGEGNYYKSTVRRRFNAGDYAGACDAFRMWNKAGGRVVRGLALRRDRERATCRKDLEQ